MQADLLHHFLANLRQLKNEIEAYTDESSVWRIRGGISNSGGTLCCHICGNLNHYVGHALGNTGYVRNRPLEFSIRDVPRSELIEMVNETSTMLSEVLPAVDLAMEYPPEMWNQKMSAGHSLIRLLAHLAYHLGQVNYHRRLLA